MNSSAASEVMSAVNQAILGQHIVDPDIVHMAGMLSQVADVVKCESAASAGNGFLNELSDLNADLLSQSEKQKVIAKQEEKLKELAKAKILVKKQLSQAESNLSKSEIEKLMTKVQDLNRKFTAEHSAAKTAKKKLDEIGYTPDISQANVKRLERRIEDLESEINALEEELSPFEGVEATNADFRAKIAEMTAKIEDIGSLFEDVE